jgi:hypothetical protein
MATGPRIDALWERLRLPAGGDLFDPATVQDLPPPARRYFLHAIAPGTPLARSVTLTMHGRIGLRPGGAKSPFTARQILSTGGLIWQAHVGRGLMRISGFDRYAEGEGAMRWSLWGVLPVARAEGPDVTRSAAGRLALEAPLWLPSALLPRSWSGWKPLWEAVNDRVARVRIKIGDEDLAPVLFLSPEGRLERIEMNRWDAKGLTGTPGYVPWVGDQIGEERTFGGYTVPTVCRAISMAGTPRENPFFEAVIEAAEYGSNSTRERGA